MRIDFKSTLTLILAIMFSTTIHADEKTQTDTAWDELRHGRAVAIMRHALAPGTSDPAGFDVNDCATQRNLSNDGRDQARSAGELFRSKNIAVANVLSSEWCRCMETAALLAIGNPQPLAALNSFFENRSTAQAQTEAVLRYLPQWLDEQSTPTVLVTHQVNISALTGSFASSGEILIITLADDKVQVLASIPTGKQEPVRE